MLGKPSDSRKDKWQNNYGSPARVALKALPPFRVDTPAGRTTVILPTTSLVARLT